MSTTRYLVSALFIFLVTGCGSGDDRNFEAELSISAPQMILSGADLGQVASDLAKQGGQPLRRMEFVNALVATVPEPALKALKKKFPGLVAIPDLEMGIVHPLGKPGPSTPPQPAEQTPWGVTAIGAPTAHEITRGAGAKICIVDTGIDKTHADLKANIVGGRNYVFNKGVIDPNAWNDDNGHGSHVSGIAAAPINGIGVVGVAPEAKLYGVKVLDKRGSGSLSAVADGVHACIAAGSHVINMSLGATGDPTQPSPLKSAVEAAAAAGITVVVAAGNSGVSITTTIPAGYPQVIAVSAVGQAQGGGYAFPSWSNFGLGLDDFAAPGVSIYSTWMSGGYNTISGTSMASPHVAGVAALRIASGAPALEATVLPTFTVEQQGAGLIDAAASVQ